MTAHLVPQAEQLRSQFEQLRTFEDVRRWDYAASSLAAEIGQAIEQVRSQIAATNWEIQKLVEERSRLPFLRRLFASRREERQLAATARQGVEYVAHVGALANDLLERVDYTPNDESERKNLLKELRADKKELQLEKKQLAAEKREINRQARVASANAGQGIFFYDSKLAASQRREIRRQKVRELAPFEDAVMAIERQLSDLDRRIMWVERFEHEPVAATEIGGSDRRSRASGR